MVGDLLAVLLSDYWLARALNKDCDCEDDYLRRITL